MKVKRKTNCQTLRVLRLAGRCSRKPLKLQHGGHQSQNGQDGGGAPRRSGSALVQAGSRAGPGDRTRRRGRARGADAAVARADDRARARGRAGASLAARAGRARRGAGRRAGACGGASGAGSTSLGGGARVGTSRGRVAGASRSRTAGSSGAGRSGSVLRLGLGRGRGSAGGHGGGGVAGLRRRGGRRLGDLGVALLDAAVVAAVVGVGVRRGGVGVGDLDGLDVHGVRRTAVVGLAASPLDGALLVIRITTGPDTQSQTHGGLGEASTSLGIVESNGSHDVAVDRPGHLILGPVNRVGVEGVLRSSHGLKGGAVIGRGVTLAEVVGLDLSGVSTEGFLYSIGLASLHA